MDIAQYKIYKFILFSHLCNLLKAREKWLMQAVIGFAFASHWLKNWRDISERITEHSNCNRVITFDSHFKTALNAITTRK